MNPIEACEKTLLTFHSNDYVQYLKKCSILNDEEKVEAQNDAEEFGIGTQFRLRIIFW